MTQWTFNARIALTVGVGIAREIVDATQTITRITRRVNGHSEGFDTKDQEEKEMDHQEQKQCLPPIQIG